MKRIDIHKKAKTKKTAVSTTLIIVSVVLLLVGIVLLLIEPIKRANRRRISNEALNEIEKKIVSTDPSEEPVATYVVPRRGNEVEGEGYDFIAETEETEEEEEEYYDDYVVLNSIGILYIDSINLRYSVWDEASQVSLRYGLGHYEDSVMPGQDGNATILGHNYRDGSMFHKLGNLSIGDEVIFIDLNGNEYYYYVVSSDIVSADDILDYALGNVTDSQRLTLITCTYEYGMTGWRRVVICEPD